ncbi:MAG TPA: helix-turn-helix domain-containing protein [Burkholderiales bacterium]|nr:helix-turn-helix domain-containing protein [Burkholderiales bacterium]
MSRLELNTPARRFVSTTDLDELHRAISDVIEPPQFSFLGSPRNLNIDISRLALPSSQIFGVKTASSVRVMIKELASVYVTFPLWGSILATSGGSERHIRPGEALMQFAGETNNLVRLGDCTTVFVRVEPRFLAPLIPDCRSEKNWRPTPGLHVLSLRNGLGRTLFNLVNQICSEARRRDAETILDQEFDKVLNYLVALIITQNRFIDVSESENGLKPPKYLDRAVEFVHQNLDQNLSLSDLTAVAHMSARTLQRAFTSHFGMGPLKFTKHARLNKVREELINYSPCETSVCQVAVKWGFHHTGNFARDYAELFGETPRQTLHKS